MIAVFIQALICIVYVAYFTIKARRILPSISDSYNFLKPKQNHYFSIFAFVLGASMLLHGNGPFKVESIILICFSSITMCSVGMAPEFSEKNDKKIPIIHFTGAALTIICDAIAVCITMPKLWIGLLAGGVCTLCLAVIPIKWIQEIKIMLIEILWIVFILSGMYMIYAGST